MSRNFLLLALLLGLISCEGPRPSASDSEAPSHFLAALGNENGTLTVFRVQPGTPKSTPKREGLTLYDPKAPDDYLKLRQYLTEKAKRMKKEPLMDDGTGPMVPADPILIRADQSTPFEYIQKIMEQCGRQGIQIWKLELAAGEGEKNE